MCTLRSILRMCYNANSENGKALNYIVQRNKEGHLCTYKSKSQYSVKKNINRQCLLFSIRCACLLVLCTDNILKMYFWAAEMSMHIPWHLSHWLRQMVVDTGFWQECKDWIHGGRVAENYEDQDVPCCWKPVLSYRQSLIMAFAENVNISMKLTGFKNENYDNSWT